MQALGYAGWINNQFSLPPTHALTNVLAHPYSDPTDLYQSPLWFNSWWQNSVTAPDQLRQRVAFALSEIFVVSENGVLVNEADALSSYYDTLLNDAFGNYRKLLEDVTLRPAMGLYLSMLGNNAGSSITGLHADENYAREVQQLFFDRPEPALAGRLAGVELPGQSRADLRPDDGTAGGHSGAAGAP